jgi:hypothetical protein
MTQGGAETCLDKAAGPRPWSGAGCDKVTTDAKITRWARHQMPDRPFRSPAGIVIEGREPATGRAPIDRRSGPQGAVQAGSEVSMRFVLGTVLVIAAITAVLLLTR